MRAASYKLDLLTTAEIFPLTKQTPRKFVNRLMNPRPAAKSNDQNSGGGYDTSAFLSTKSNVQE